MRFAVFLMISHSLAAQESGVVHQVAVDASGNRLEGPTVSQVSSKNQVERTELAKSVNGHLVPLERTEERILRDDASVKVVERIVRSYDPNGNPGPPVKTVIEEHRQASGSTVQTMVYRADLNGNFVVAERSNTQISKRGNQLDSETVVERQTINGSFEAVEKRTVTRAETGKNYQESSVTYRKGPNGFEEAAKIVTEHSESGGQTAENAAVYRQGSSGRLELLEQLVTRTSKRADGSVVSEVDRFGTSVPGTISTDGKLKLKEHDVVEKRAGSGGSVVETVTVRQPSVSDPNVLGAARVVSETVCRGKCP